MDFEQSRGKWLTAPAENTSVTAVAFACGFDNPGHFAGDYRLAFGELPSQTLTKVKGPAYQSHAASLETGSDRQSP